MRRCKYSLIEEIQSKPIIMSFYNNQSNGQKLKTFSIPVRKNLGKGHSFSASEGGI